uniref:Uncharacterized protein n=1 Tax=Arundo donax TaxID=35708 RepID=A0A0A9E482_ARUDO
MAKFIYLLKQRFVSASVIILIIKDS